MANHDIQGPACAQIDQARIRRQAQEAIRKIDIELAYVEEVLNAIHQAAVRYQKAMHTKHLDYGDASVSKAINALEAKRLFLRNRKTAIEIRNRE